MDTDEESFNIRAKKIEDFKAELNNLINKYGFGTTEIDEYDGSGDYCKTDHYFVVDGETWHNETILDILGESIVFF